jgi:hypothetical protein
MGRVALVEKKIVSNQRKLFDDSITKIRDNAYTCLINLAEYTEGINAVIEFQILPVLIDKLVLE